MAKLNRRSFVKSVGAGAVALTAMGVTSASDGRTQFVVTVGGKGGRKKLEQSGVDVQGSVADGRVLLVAAESKATIQEVNGVKHVEPNIGYRAVGPKLQSTEESLDEQYADIQWDKQADTTGAFEAHDSSTGDGRTVAIIDTGIDTFHPDLRNRVERGQLFRADGVSSPDGSPTVDGDTTIEARLPPGDEEIESYTYLGAPERRSQMAADDVDSHGTHCAGIATAKHDDTSVGEDFGIAGMAPDADVVPLRVFYWKRLDDYQYDVDGDGEDESVTVTTLWTTDFDILSAIDYAANIGADSANMSLGGGVIKGSAHKNGEHVAYQKVIQSAVQRGTVVTTSAGNASSDLQHEGYYTLPNSVPGSISVSATGPDNGLAFYSNYGTSDIDVGAPGGGYETLEKTLASDTEWPYPLNLVYSTVPPDLNDGTAYAWYAGTSMAAPQVAGLVALIREVNPDMSAKQVQSIIENTARYSNGKSDADIGAGVIYAPDAVAEAKRRN
ncbi:Serine protease, subtilisin family [Haladaptatus litoreus]|uniref:Serine protease, subtilisin family n=1 Tax=Haladaptatus litoreus TaxID=553468 RepID=A0A1N6W061_9EURY|nr:S8 family serine peptidase [Haladaptatus litoreus]SIQ83296.1 Serine protease, subtilisin family [Haladaptatus litoreus]